MTAFLLQKSRHVNNQFNRNCDSEMGRQILYLLFKKTFFFIQGQPLTLH